MTAPPPCFSARVFSDEDGPGIPTAPDPRSALEEVFSVVYREHYQRLVRLVYPVVRDVSAAEDVAQETMSRFMTKAEDLDTSTPVWPWLRTVAMRLAIDYYRRTSREMSWETREVVEDEEIGARTDVPWCEEGPQLLSALQNLPTRQRQALALRYLHDREPAEVARALNLSKGALEQLVHRARKNMLHEYRRVS